ncbi:virion core protein, T7 gp14 family [Shimia sp.]|uniref:virion core protein, T7 gp14 family n=1 Tax=Shimia sp. TaxID=1954381 RepID=UPI003BAA41BE
MSFPLIATAMQSAFAAIGTYGSAITAGLAVGQTALSYQQAAGMADITEAQNKQANDRARVYMIEDQDKITQIGQQERAAATQRVNQAQIDASKAASSAQVAATAGGVSGLSVDALLGDIFGQEASIRDSVNQNLENTGVQLQAERNSVQRGYSNTINTRPTPQHPSLLGSALQAGTGVVGAYRDTWKIRGRSGGTGE